MKLLLRQTLQYNTDLILNVALVALLSDEMLQADGKMCSDQTEEADFIVKRE